MTRSIWIRRTYPAPGQINDDYLEVPDAAVVLFQAFALTGLFAGLLFLAFGAS